jgi:ABC-type uncharacterized transport system ATPase subunit
MSTSGSYQTGDYAAWTGGLPPRLVVRGLSRRYGDVVANDGIDLDVGRGDVVGLLGENGAGKSTFLSILSGLTAPDAGDIEVDGRSVVLRRPSDALAAGIGTVFQHFALVPVFTVREQLRLGGLHSDAISNLLDEVDLDRRIADLSAGERQQVELARVLARRPRVLLLDEPTSTLTAGQVDRLFARIRRLRDDGVGVVFITHKLPEVLAVADRIVVLRRGRVTAEIDRRRLGGHWPGGIDRRLLKAMFGDAAEAEGAVARDGLAAAGVAMAEGTALGQQAIQEAEILLAVERASAMTSYGRHRPTDVAFSVPAGEMLAILGIDGQGQRELAEMLAGHLPMTGRMFVDGHDVSVMNAKERQRAGVGYLTDDRTGEGTVGNLSVALNLILKRQRAAEFQRAGVLRLARVGRHARQQIAQWGITPPLPTVRVETLSGGNTQKVMLGRELELQPRVLIATNPAHGLDLRTQTLVWDALRRVTANGGVVVLLTPHVTEALTHSDRVAVLSAGRLSPAVPVSGTDGATLSRMMVHGW